MTPDFTDLQPGQRVTVRAAAGASDASYESAVRGISREAVELDHPRAGNQRMPVRPGERLDLHVERFGRLHSFSTTARETRDLPRPLLIVDPPRATERSDRREFFRLDTAIRPNYAARVNEDGEELERLDLVIMDISGGGVQMRSRTHVEPGSLVRLIFALDGNVIDIDLTALVLTSLPEVRTNQIRLHARFTQISRSMQDRVIRFVFREQVERLKRGVM